MTQKLLALYGLKWNPFEAGVPTTALRRSPSIDTFCGRVEHLTHRGGFALITGQPGLGKSVSLRILCEHLQSAGDLAVGILSRPQASLHDFYRELGAIFDVQLAPHNRWGGTRVLRARWLHHIDTCLLHPVLLIDEAQEMHPAVLNELRLLAAVDLDARCLLTIVLAGDERLTEKFRSPELLSVGTRIRARLALVPADPEELAEGLQHLITQAGCPHLMTPPLIATLAEHAAGNWRILMNMAAELLEAAAAREKEQLDEQLYLEVFNPTPAQQRRGAKRMVPQ